MSWGSTAANLFEQMPHAEAMEPIDGPVLGRFDLRDQLALEELRQLLFTLQWPGS